MFKVIPPKCRYHRSRWESRWNFIPKAPDFWTRNIVKGDVMRTSTDPKDEREVRQ